MLKKQIFIFFILLLLPLQITTAGFDEHGFAKRLIKATMLGLTTQYSLSLPSKILNVLKKRNEFNTNKNRLQTYWEPELERLNKTLSKEKIQSNHHWKFSDTEKNKGYKQYLSYNNKNAKTEYPLNMLETYLAVIPYKYYLIDFTSIIAGCYFVAAFIKVFYISPN